MNAAEFEQVKSYFPNVSLPITLSEESIKDISKTNKPIDGKSLAVIMEQWVIEYDEFTEIVPCLSLPSTEKYHPFIYWKAGLLTHEYVLVTLDHHYRVINQKVIAGIASKDDKVLRSVATIEEDLTIHVMVGVQQHQQYNPMQSTAYYMELTPDGEITLQQEEEPLEWAEKTNTDPKK